RITANSHSDMKENHNGLVRSASHLAPNAMNSPAVARPAARGHSRFRKKNVVCPCFWLLTAFHACRSHVGPGAGKRAVEVDRAARFLDYRGIEAGGAGIQRGPGDAGVGSEAAHVETTQVSFSQIP